MPRENICVYLCDCPLWIYDEHITWDSGEYVHAGIFFLFLCFIEPDYNYRDWQLEMITQPTEMNLNESLHHSDSGILFRLGFSFSCYCGCCHKLQHTYSSLVLWGTWHSKYGVWLQICRQESKTHIKARISLSSLRLAVADNLTVAGSCVLNPFTPENFFNHLPFSCSNSCFMLMLYTKIKNQVS